MRFSRLLAVALLIVTAIPAARAQLPALDPLTAPMAEVLVKAKQKSAIVLDFSGPGDKHAALSQALAEKFSLALSRTAARMTLCAQGSSLRSDR